MPLTSLSSKIAVALEGNQSGFFGACVPRGAVTDLDGKVKSRLKKNNASKARAIPLGVTQEWFHTHAESDDKLLWIGSLENYSSVLQTLLGTRVFINTYPQKSACVVVVGAWNVLEVIRNWPRHGSIFEAHHFEFCEGLPVDSIKIIFEKILPKDSRQADAFAELIREETGGQQWLFNPLVPMLQQRANTDLAVALRNLHRSPSISGEVELREGLLNQTQRTLLENLLHRRILRIASKNLMPDALELWLMGFARFREAPDHAILNQTEFCLIPPAPVIERCLRGNRNLLLASPAISAAIQPLLFDFENRLRDLVMSVMTKAFGAEWETKLSSIRLEKAPPDDESQPMECRMKNGLKEGSVINPALAETTPSQRLQKDTLYGFVSKARANFDALHVNPTTGVSCLSFLTFAHLASVLTHGSWYETCFKPIFHPLTANTLKAKLDELAQIRNAVAHHYPLKFSQLVDAQRLINELLDRMALRV